MAKSSLWSDHAVQFKQRVEELAVEVEDPFYGTVSQSALRAHRWLDSVLERLEDDHDLPSFRFDSRKLRSSTFADVLWHLSWFEHVFVEMKKFPAVVFLLPFMGGERKFILRSARKQLCGLCTRCHHVHTVCLHSGPSGYRHDCARVVGEESQKELLRRLFPEESRFYDQPNRNPKQTMQYTFLYQSLELSNREPVPVSYDSVMATLGGGTLTRQKKLARLLLDILKADFSDPLLTEKLGGPEQVQLNARAEWDVFHFLLITHTCECAPISTDHAKLLLTMNRKDGQGHMGVDLVNLYRHLDSERARLKSQGHGRNSKELLDTRMTGRVMESEKLLQCLLEQFITDHQVEGFDEHLRRNYPLMKRNTGVREGRRLTKVDERDLVNIIGFYSTRPRPEVLKEYPFRYLVQSLRSSYSHKLSVLKELPGPVDTHIDHIFVPPDYFLMKKWENVFEGTDISESNSLEQVISCVSGEEKILLLKGAPAVGKTLLMKKMAFDWAGGGRGGIADFALVFFIQLARVKEWKDANCLDTALAHCGKAFDPLLGEASGELKAKMCDSLAHKKILFLLDGLDEGALEMEDTEEKLRAKLTRGCEGAENFSFIISSRSYSYQIENTENFARLELLGLTSFEKRSAYVRKKIESRGTDRNNAQIEDFLLTQVLPEKSEDDELFTNPVLFSFVFLVVEERMASKEWVHSIEQLKELEWALKTSKTSLYYQALKIFRDRHLQKTGRFESDRTERWFDDGNLTEVKRLAFHKLTTLCDEENQLRISEEEALDVNATALEIGYLMKEETQSATEFLFHHKTVMEFFAALYFVERADVSVSFKKLKKFPIFYLEEKLKSLSEVITFALELFRLLEIRKDSEGEKFLKNRLRSLTEHWTGTLEGFPDFLLNIGRTSRDPDWKWFPLQNETKQLVLYLERIAGDAHFHEMCRGPGSRTKFCFLEEDVPTVAEMLGRSTKGTMREKESVSHPGCRVEWVGHWTMAIGRTSNNAVVALIPHSFSSGQEDFVKAGELLRSEITCPSQESPSALIFHPPDVGMTIIGDTICRPFSQLVPLHKSIRSLGLFFRIGPEKGFMIEEIESIPDTINEFRTNVSLSIFGSDFSIPPKKEVEGAIGRLSRLDALSFELPQLEEVGISKEKFIEWLIGELKPNCRLMLVVHSRLDQDELRLFQPVTD